MTRCWPGTPARKAGPADYEVSRQEGAESTGPGQGSGTSGTEQHPAEGMWQRCCPWTGAGEGAPQPPERAVGGPRRTPLSAAAHAPSPLHPGEMPGQQTGHRGSRHQIPTLLGHHEPHFSHTAGTGDSGPEDSTQQEWPVWDPVWKGSKHRLCDLEPLALRLRLPPVPRR